MKKVDRETAESDLQRFIDDIGINELKLSKIEDEREAVTTLIEHGYLVVNEAGSLTYNLQYPVKNDDGQISLESIDLKQKRYSVGDLEKHMVGKSDLEKTRKMLAHMTGENAGLIYKIDSEDLIALGEITAFFLPR